MRFLAVVAALVVLTMLMAAGVDQPGAAGAQECLPAVPFDEVPLPGPDVQQAQPGVQAGPVPAGVAIIYEQTAAEYGIPAAVLMGVGWEETKHGSAMAVSSAGAQGFMQFMPATWQAYGQGGNPEDPVDAIPAAARLLVANGAAEGGDGILRALLAYNHATWYVNDVLTWAHQYSGAASQTGCTDTNEGISNASVATLLNTPTMTLDQDAVGDLKSGAIDSRLVSLLVWLGERHDQIVVTVLKTGHPYRTTNGSVSNHSYGRAVDIGAVDSTVCRNQTPADPCGALAVEVARMTGPLKPTEIIACFDADGPGPAFAAADHCDHDHFGYDG